MSIFVAGAKKKWWSHRKNMRLTERISALNASESITKATSQKEDSFTIIDEARHDFFLLNFLKSYLHYHNNWQVEG